MMIIDTKNIRLKAEIISTYSIGQFLSMNPPEMIVDDIYDAGCFEIIDEDILGEEVTYSNIEGKNYFHVRPTI